MMIENIAKKKCVDIHHEWMSLKSEERQKVFHFYSEQINSTRNLKSDSTRIELVKAVVSFLPDSLSLIDNLLSNFENDLNYELHFTIFCYLDSASFFLQRDFYNRNVVTLAKSYLLNVREDKGQSSWMAGDYLGMHTDPSISVPILKNIISSEEALYEGKAAALSGLESYIKKSLEIIKFLQDYSGKTDDGVLAEDICNVLGGVGIIS